MPCRRVLPLATAERVLVGRGTILVSAGRTVALGLGAGDSVEIAGMVGDCFGRVVTVLNVRPAGVLVPEALGDPAEHPKTPIIIEASTRTI